MQERQLEGENASVDRTPRPAKAKKETPPTGLGIAPDDDAATLPGGRPSPFGPKDGEDAAKPADTSAKPASSSAKPADASAKPADNSAGSEPPSELPGGRPSPFGPRN